MGLEVLLAREQQQRSRCRYQRLRGDGDDGVEVGVARSAVAAAGVRARRPLRLRMRMGKRKQAGRWAPLLFRMARPGGKIKVRLMRLVFLVPARRVAALFAELVRRLASVDVAAECPTIVFSSQWGLPVLSHSASDGAAGRTARLRAFYLERSLSTSPGGGADSPC